MFLFFVEINDSIVDFDDLVDILIAYEQKLDVLEILLIDLQFLVDESVELKQRALLVNQFLIVYMAAWVLPEVKLAEKMMK